MTRHASSSEGKATRKNALILGAVAFAFYFGFILVGVLHA